MGDSEFDEGKVGSVGGEGGENRRRLGEDRSGVGFVGALWMEGGIVSKLRGGRRAEGRRTFLSPIA